MIHLYETESGVFCHASSLTVADTLYLHRRRMLRAVDYNDLRPECRRALRTEILRAVGEHRRRGTVAFWGVARATFAHVGRA
jgi:hypothetical protein